MLRSRPVVREALSRCRQAALARFCRNSRGGAASEFALVAAPFVALTLAILQVGIIYFAQQALETTVEQTARLVLTGQALSAGMSQAQFANALCINNPGLFNCSGFMIDLQQAASFAAVDTSKPTLTFKPDGSVSNTWQYNLGNPGDIMVMRVMYQWPVFLGPLSLNLANLSNNKHLLMATSVFRNEPT
jgi:Flp pilus assembly protein TadG